MKKLLAVLVVFALAAFVSAYVALAPLAGSGPEELRELLTILDRGAARLSDFAGRGPTALALLGAGLAIALLLAFGIGRKGRQSDSDEAIPAPGPLWSPDPDASEDRIASLRRRAGADMAEEAASEAPDAPPPVVLARKVRERGDDWTDHASWLGGVPRLADAEWPRDAGGRALPFAAQIDLGELARACPQSPLPHEGALAFFLGAGAVIAVPPGKHPLTEPPADLPPAYEEDGTPFPPAPSRLSRYIFPLWPVDLISLSDAAFSEPSHSLAAGEELWWYGVFHLVDRMREALDGSERVLAREARLEAKAEDALAGLEARADAEPEAAADARRQLHEIQARRREIEQEASALPAMVEALDSFVANRDPWEPLTGEERALVVEILDEIHRRHGTLVGHSLPHSPAPLQALCIRAMASGPPEAFAALPDETIARIAREHRVPPGASHRIFDSADDLMLLQLGSDDMMESRWPDEGKFQFRISRQDAAMGNWDKARLSFRSA